VTKFDTTDEARVRELIRESFPPDAGMSAEKTRSLYAQLRPVEAAAPRRRRAAWIAVASGVATLAVAAGAFAIYSAMPGPVPEVNLADRYEASRANRPQPTAPKSQPTAIPAMALRAISEPNDVLHFTSVADKSFGPGAGHSTEEMWFDPKTGAGRLVRDDYTGEKVVLTTTIVSDGTLATITTQKAGGSPVTETAEPEGRWRKSFDKLSAYRNMLESGAATVTARGTHDGVETYKLQSRIGGFGGSELDVVMEAEIRATDYLPVSYSSRFEDAEGNKTVELGRRTFSSFERVEGADLPAGWLTPQPTGPAGGSVSDPGVVEL